MWLDLKFAFRMLLKQPSYSIISVLAIALGISTTTSQFTFFNGLFLRPIPYVQDEASVLSVKCFSEKQPASDFGLSQSTFSDLREQCRTLEGFTIAQPRTFIISGAEQPERVLGGWISAAAFPMLGVQPFLGRSFRAEEEAEDALPVAILSHALWKRSFAANKEITGQTAILNGEPVTIVGVMPEGFLYPDTFELWMPFHLNEQKQDDRAQFSWKVVARLRSGFTLAQANAELATIAAQIARDHPAEHAGIGLRALPVREEANRGVRDLMFIIMGSVLAVLLIACGNVTNLMLAKGAARSREIAIRLALGATRRRIVALVLIESLVISLVGGFLGILLAAWKIDLIVSILPNELPFWLKFEMDWRVITYGISLVLLSSVLAGLLPALHTSRSELNEELKDSSRGCTGSGESLRIRNILVVSQLAIALILLVGAGLLMRSFLELRSADPGVDPNQVLTYRVGLPPTQFKDMSVVRDFWTRVTARVREIPGVENAGFVASLPSQESYDFGAVYVEGRTMPRSLAEAEACFHRTASPGALETLRIPLVLGRALTAADDEKAPRVLLVDQAFVQQLMGGADPLGKRIAFGKPDDPARVWWTVVGVVGNARQVPPGRNLPERSVWIPVAQELDVHFLSGVVRVKSGDPMSYVRAVQDAIGAVEPDIPLYYPKPMTQIIADSQGDARFFSRVFVSFAATALFLAAIGIYGVMSYSVSQRTQEIGVRMALGARPGQVVGMILKQGARLVCAGLVIGFAGAWLVVNFLGAFLYQVKPHDPPTFALVPLLLAAVAIFACYLPSRRATRIEPIAALRAD